MTDRNQRLLPAALCAVLLAAALVGCASVSPSGVDAAAPTDDGLVPVKVKNVDRAWERPGASLSGYRRVLIRPVTVAFAKRWNPADYGVRGLGSRDVERIRSSLAQLAQDTFSRVLTRGGYQVVDAPGEDVLDVEAEIVDLYVNAPEVNDSNNSRTYVLSAGEMRILVTLRDAITGTTLYRARDFKRGPETGRLEWANSVWNRAEAERALAGWASQLRDALDAATQHP